MNKQSKKIAYKNTAIDTIRNKYDETLFRMGLTHLIDVGVRHIQDMDIEKTKESLRKNEKPNSLMTADFQIKIIECALELSNFSPVELMRYINKAMFFENN